MKSIGSNYFSCLLKKYSIFTILFITMFFVTATYAIDKFNLLSGNVSVRNAILFSFAIIAVVYGFFFIKKINTKGISFDDAFIWGLFLFLIAFTVYSFITGINTKKLIVLLAVEPFIVFFVLYRLFYFDKAECAEHKTYFKTLFKKYTCFVPVICSILFIAAFYVAEKANLLQEFSRLFNTDLYLKILCIITVLTFALFVFTAAAKRNVNAIDFIIYFAIVSSILTAAYSVVFGFNKQLLITACIALFLACVFLFIRMRTFNLKVHRAVFLDIIKGSYEINLLAYFKKLFKKYDGFFSLFIASLLSVVTYLTFKFALFDKTTTYIGFTAISFYAIYGLIGLGILAALIIVIKNFTSIHVNVSDFLIFTGFISSICCFVSIILTTKVDAIILTIFALQILITQIILVSRSTEVFVFNGKR